MRPSSRAIPRVAAAAAVLVVTLLVVVSSPAPAEATHASASPKPVPVRIKLDDAFGPNQVVVPPLSLGGNPFTTESKTLKLKGYVDGTAVISLLSGKVTINFTSANLTIDPIVLDASTCPALRTSPITVRLDPAKTSSATADIFRGTATLTLNALVRTSVVSDGSPCGQPVEAGPYVETPISQRASGGTFQLRIGIREGRLMLGVVKGEATAPNTVIVACLASGSPDTPCPPGSSIALDPTTLTVKMAGWVGLR